MLARFISWWNPVRLAQSAEEREAVYRLRYAVYVRELRKEHAPGVDHARQEIRDPEDERAGAAIFYPGAPLAPTGTLRADVYRAGELAATVRDRYSLDRLPELE